MITPLRRKLAELRREPLRAPKLGLGGLVGIGSFLYAFLRIAGWVDDPELRGEAAKLATLMTPQRIAADEHLDVVSGSAGGILALLAADAETSAEDGKGDLQPRAEALARHLLDTRAAFQGRGNRGWPGPGGRPPLSGFAHGAAGITYALLRLFDCTGRQEYLDAALEGQAYERGLYLPSERSWWDPRFGRPIEQVGWCHGAPGIALGRLGGLSIREDPAVHEEIRETLAITREAPPALFDHLCCGNASRMEVLLTASTILGDDALAVDAWRMAKAVLERTGETGTFALRAEDGSSNQSPNSLFFGLAGVGFTLLRLAHPRELPSLLLLQ